MRRDRACPAAACQMARRLEQREQVEPGLTLLGLVAMEDPPAAEAAAAVASCHQAGIRILVITGDHPLTAAAIARRVGIGGGHSTNGDGGRVETMPQNELTDLLVAATRRSFSPGPPPEAKLRIAETLRNLGHVVAMTGDGVNDAPALRRADIGVAMGRSGHRRRARGRHDGSLGRQLRDDRGGDRGRTTCLRQRPQVHRLHLRPRHSRGASRSSFSRSPVALVPLPLTVLQLLAFDVGSETLPSLALGARSGRAGNDGAAAAAANEGLIRGRCSSGPGCFSE